jgi:hypothetical protein
MTQRFESLAIFAGEREDSGHQPKIHNLSKDESFKSFFAEIRQKVRVISLFFLASKLLCERRVGTNFKRNLFFTFFSFIKAKNKALGTRY